MAKLQFREFRIADLKAAHYNPPSRTKDEAISGLVRSIGDIGLLYPILVTNDGTIIDGHRRVAAHKELSMETIPAIIGVGDPNKLYASVNVTSRKMGGNEALQVFLKEPEAITSLLRARFNKMIEVLGEPRVRKMARQGYSIRIYNRARQVAIYCDQDEVMIPTIFDWLITTQTHTALSAALVNDVSPGTIMKAVRSNRKLKLTSVVSD
jgi:hypothetical protein